MRDDLKQFLNKREIQTGIHYPTLLPKLEAYERLSQRRDDTFAHSTSDMDLLSLPIGDHMNTNDALYVCQEIRHFFSGC